MSVEMHFKLDDPGDVQRPALVLERPHAPAFAKPRRRLALVDLFDQRSLDLVEQCRGKYGFFQELEMIAVNL
jgi:hypothetical protein